MAVMAEKREGLQAAVSEDRWLELLDTRPSDEAVTWATQGLARLALFRNDWRVCEPLLERTGDALFAGLHAVSAIGDAEAIEALEARFQTAQTDDEAVALLRVLDALGSGLRLSLPDERVRRLDAHAFDSRVYALAREGRPAELVAQAAASEVEARWKSVLDREGGTSKDLELLATVASELRPEDVEAWRRRDGEALCAAITRLSDVDVSGARPRDATEVALRVAIAKACVDTIREARPRKFELDALGAAGLVQALLARARIDGDARSAVVLALMGEARVWETVRAPGEEGRRWVDVLARSPLPRAAEALVACAQGWNLSGFGERLVERAGEGGFIWAYAHARLAVRMEDEVLDALEAKESLADGHTSLLSQLVSPRAEALALRTIGTSELLTRLYLWGVVRAFPTDAMLRTLRLAPSLGSVELERRFELLAEYEPSLEGFDPKAAFVWCENCGYATNVAPESLASVRQALVLRPAVACPGCEATGTQAGADPTRAERTLELYPAFEAEETPRQALARFAQKPDEYALDICEALVLCGEREAALNAFQLVAPGERLVDAPRIADLLLELGDAGRAKDVVEQALRHPEAWAVWSAEEVRGLQERLAQACEAMGVSVPDIAPVAPKVEMPDVRSSPGRKVGRNEPCPCGSGRKFKKCHGG